jgi:3-oxoacyl-[acyl-carrier-protein] synthase-3
MGIKIIGTGKALPDKTVTNDMLSHYIETSDEWIYSHTGIRERRVCTTETAVDLAEQAAVNAVSNAGVSLSDIDMVICATVSGDYITPSLACCLIERLGISAPAFDIGAACSGFLYALDTADTYISAGKARHILIVGVERMSRYLDWTDRNTCILMGDGAGACVIAPGSAVKYARLWAAGDVEPLHIPAGTGNSPFAAEHHNARFLKMNGQHIFKFAVRTVEAEIKKALEAVDMDAKDVDYFILHQANKRIIDSARAKLGQPEEKFPVNIEKYGNLSAASIPVLLDEMVTDGKIRPGSKLVLTAFGGGTTAATMVIIWA